MVYQSFCIFVQTINVINVIFQSKETALLVEGTPTISLLITHYTSYNSTALNVTFFWLRWLLPTAWNSLTEFSFIVRLISWNLKTSMIILFVFFRNWLCKLESGSSKIKYWRGCICKYKSKGTNCTGKS